MYVIIVYDIDVKRVAKVCKYLRQHLNWVQNSVFEGELTKAQFARVKSGLLGIIDESEDSVLIYQMRHEKWMDKQAIGVEKIRSQTSYDGVRQGVETFSRER